jgi:diguanylate cyclase (GGDEF)-like protein
MLIHQSSEQHNLEQHTIWLPLIVAMLFGGIGAALNLFAVPYLPNVHIIFGNLAYVVVAMRLRPMFALLTAIITVTPLMLIWGHPFGFITFGLEAYFIAKLRERGWYVLFADIVYWLIIGMPLTALIIWLYLPNPFSYLLFASIKQGFNGLLYASIACLIVFFFSDKLRFKQYQQVKITRGLRSQLMYSILLVTTCSVVVATQFGSRHIIENEQQLVTKTLSDGAKSIADVANVFINQHKRIIALAAYQLSKTPAVAQKQQLLLDIHHNIDDFNTMLIADRAGDIVQASPLVLMPMLQQMAENNVQDKHYFQHAIAGSRVYVSPVFQEPGFGQDVLLAISAAIFNDQETEPIGVVQGTLKANIAQQLSLAKLGEQDVSIVIIDQQNQVVFASPELGLSALSQFYYQNVRDSLPTQQISLPHSDAQYLFAKQAMVEQWQVFALMDGGVIINNIERQFIGIFLILAVTLCISTLVAFSFSQRLTKPLQFILQQIKQHDQKSSDKLAPLYMDSTREITQIYEELKSDKRQVYEYQTLLEQKVNQRTAELKDANQKLQQLAMRDGLTGAFNRYYLDENFSVIQKTAQRHHGTLAVVMLDIDHFKKLNDNYGHLTGDQCLIKLAKLIHQQFARETDTLIRFGGEEFMLLLPDISAPKLHTMLESLRTTIAEHVFYSTEHQEFHFTVSMGALIAMADFSHEMRKWVKIADDALYSAKDSGRNIVLIENRLSALPIDEHSDS